MIDSRCLLPLESGNSAVDLGYPRGAPAVTAGRGKERPLDRDIPDTPEYAPVSNNDYLVQRIEDRYGRFWNDGGSWWWSMLLGGRHGPWPGVLMVTR